MFNFLYKDKRNEMSYIDVITENWTRAAIAELADEKARGMIARAIAKSEFVVKGKSGREKNHLYWMLNVRPNANETGTDFWIRAIKKLLKNQECKICILAEKMYIVESCQETKYVLTPNAYSNIVIQSGNNQYAIDKTVTADDMLHLRLYDEKKKAYHNKVKENYNAIYSAISEMNKASNALKLELTYDAQGPILRRKNPDGTEVKVTMDEYKKEVQKMITSDKMQIINHGKGIEIKQLELKSNASISDLSSIIKEIFTECAMAYDIPVAAYMGTITEKSDAANEFITYAVSPVLSIIEDSMNAKLVGEDCYLSGERIWIDISRYKHVDVIECADKLDKLRSIGFNFDEVRNLIGWDELQTDFSQERVITKNYTNDLGISENKGTE